MADRFGPHVERLRAVAASPARRLLALGGWRDVGRASGARPGPDAASSLHILALPKLKAVASLAVDGAVHAVCFAGDELVLAGLSTGAIVAWDAGLLAGGKAGEAGDALPRALTLADAHGGPVHALAVDGAGRLLASVGDDGVLRLSALVQDAGSWRLEPVATRALSSRPLRAVAFSDGGAAVAAAGDDGVIRVVPVAGDAAAREMPCGEGGIQSLCFTGDGRVAAGCGDGTIQLCYLEGAVDADDRAGEAAHAGPVRGLCMGDTLKDEAGRPLPRRLFSIGEDGELKAWQLDTRRRPQTTRLGSERLQAMVLIPAGRGAKAERRGGTLAVVDDGRRLLLVPVSERSETGAEAGAQAGSDIERVRSHLDRLGEDLDASSVKVRLEAVRALGALGPLLEDDARALIERALGRDGKPEVRKQAAEVLGAVGSRLGRPALRQALNDGDAGVRAAALAALTAIERDTPLAPVRAALASRHADMRTAAVKRLPGLRAASPLVPGLVAGCLQDQADAVRAAALDALHALEAEGSIEPARTAMQRGPADIRAAALLRLARAGLAATPAGAALVAAALDDDAADVRRTAFLVSVAARPALAARLRGIDDGLRRSLADVGSIPGAAPGATIDDAAATPLLAALTCRHPDIALLAARCLGLLGDGRATGALLQLSREAGADVRRQVADALARAAMAMPADDRLVTRLRWLLDDADATVRAAAFDALAALGAPEGTAAALDLAAQALRSSREDIRQRALPILTQLGPQAGHAQAGAAGELLGRALDDESDKVRGNAFATLWAWYAAGDRRTSDPRTPLTLGAACRHADVRRRVVAELARLGDRAPGGGNAWADQLLLTLVRDSAAEVGLAAYETLTGKGDAGQGAKKVDRKLAERVEIHRAAMDSPRPEVRAAGCKGAPRSAAPALRQRLGALVRDEHPAVHLAAIEAADRLVPDDADAFAAAFGSVFYELQVRAAELCGKRRDRRAVAPIHELLAIPRTRIDRPADVLRQRAARALADIGDPVTMPFLVTLLDDADPIVREMAARGLATAARPGDEQPLIDALAHADLPVRSWAAEGLARLGDDRAVPVLAGTLAHDHRPIRLGAIMGFAALGPDGVQGLLQGLDDADRDVQDLVLAVIVARDVALARASRPPDLLLAALTAASPELRLAAARLFEARVAGGDLAAAAEELVGPRRPDKAADMKDWPAEDERRARLEGLVAALASDHPAQRYAAAQVLSLRGQALAFWREAGRLLGPTAAERPRIPYTNWEDGEARQPRKQGWIRRLLGRERQPAASATERVLTVLRFAGAPAGRAVPPDSDGDSAASLDRGEAGRLLFGTYAGLVRQAPARGEADETHRVRRDAIDRLAALAAADAVGRDAVLAVLRRALGDPHHLVRKAAAGALRGLYPAGALAPLALALDAAPDVGRAAVDELVAAALAGADDDDDAGTVTAAAAKATVEAAAMVRGALDAPAPEVRAHALAQLPRLFEAGSLEPWLIALASRHADVRLAVVRRLMEALDAPAAATLGADARERVSAALGRALESDHDDLRMEAAVALARRGDARTVEVLAGALRADAAAGADQQAMVTRAVEALVALAHARPVAANGNASAVAAPGAANTANTIDAAGAAARAIAARLDDDPDRTADRPALMDALGRIGSAAAGDTLLGLLAGDDAGIRGQSLDALLRIARKRDAHGRELPPRPVPGRDAGARRTVYDESLALTYLREVAASADTALRARVARVLQDIDSADAEPVLARLVEDRDQAVRVAACETLAFRAEHVAGARLDVLAGALRAGRRELVLPAAFGLASRGRPEAFQALLLVLEAGEAAERERAVLALGMLGDRRALEKLEPLAGGQAGAEQAEDDAALAPVAAEALGRMLPHLRDDDPAHAGEHGRVRDLVERLAREGASDVRRRAMTGLRHAGDERARGLLEHLLADRDEQAPVRVHAADELGALGNVASEAALADALSEDAPALRRAALRALERVFGGGVAQRTRTSLLALRSRHADISAPAATFLARAGDPAVLVARLSDIDDAEVRRRLRQGLIRRGACPVAELEALLAAATNDVDQGPRADAAWIAGAAASAPERLAPADRQRLTRALLPALDSASSAWTAARARSSGPAATETARAHVTRAEEAWEACLWAAGRLGADASAAAGQALAQADAPAGVLRQALHLVSAQARPADLDAGIDQIRPLLSHPDASVRAAAAAGLASLAALAPGRARDTLAAMAVADAAAMGPLAAAALAEAAESAEAGDLTAGRALLTGDGSRRVVLPVVIGQGRVDALVAVATAGGAARAGSPDPTKDPARLVAIAALGRMGGAAAAAALGSIFQDRGEHEAVRAAAFRALRRLQRGAARQARHGTPSDEGHNR